VNSRLAEALNLLRMSSVDYIDDAGHAATISAKEHAKALFTYLNMGNYLAENLMEKAVKYLSASKPFAYENDIVLADLKRALRSAKTNEKFNADIFIAEFAKESYFTANDIIDLLTFLQQTAFDRQFGVERDALPPKHWIKANQKEFYQLARQLDIISEKAPRKDYYAAVAIMGAASSRVKTRLDYFLNLNVEYGHVWALSGKRELSKGLDEDDVMIKVAESVGKPANFVEKQNGSVSRVFLDGVTETMLVNYMINKDRAQKINVVDSEVQADHWRATTEQGAVDVAKLLLNKIQANEVKHAEDGRYHFFIIAEQPYPVRMAKQVQREFDKEIKRRNLEEKIVVEVEGCGSGLQEEKAAGDELLRVDSELGALIAERFYDARLALAQSTHDFRDPGIILFSSRDTKYKALQEALESKPTAMSRP
jgi:hypothetical protein